MDGLYTEHVHNVWRICGVRLALLLHRLPFEKQWATIAASSPCIPEVLWRT